MMKLNFRSDTRKEMNMEWLPIKDKLYYSDEAIAIYHADCREILPLLPDKSVDLVLTDPPYGITQNKWDEPFYDLDILHANNAKIVFAHQPYSSELVIKHRAIFRYELIWEKSKSTGFLDCSKRPLRSHEQILVFGNAYQVYNPQKEDGEAWYRGRVKRPSSNWGTQKENISNNPSGLRQPKSVLFFPNPNNKTEHPTQKPIELIEYLIKTYSNTGDTILDPFLGSGTTAIGAKKLGRKCIGIEIEEKYCEIAANRCRQKIMGLEDGTSIQI